MTSYMVYWPKFFRFFVLQFIHLLGKKQAKYLWEQMGAISEYPATYLHISQRFKKRGISKQKDPFKFNEMQISGRVF